MRSEATGWKVIQVTLLCPLCTQSLLAHTLDSEEPRLPYHSVRRSPISCNGSGKTPEDAEALDTLRQRAHP